MALDSRLKSSRVRVPAVPLSGNNLGQVVRAHVPRSPSSVIRAAMSCGWEGNCRFGVALAVRRRLKWFIHPRVQGLIRYDTRCYFNVRSKADMNRLNLPHGDDN